MRKGLLLVWMALLAAPASAATFTVNTTADTDDGTCNAAHCSLREALNAAATNAGADTIAFAIPGSGVKTIAPTSCLPWATGPVTIDGYTQPGSSPNTNATGAINAVPLIELRGGGCGVGLELVWESSSLTVRGLILNGFASRALAATRSSLVVEGCFIGTTADGMAAYEPSHQDAGHGIMVGSSSVVVGGTTPAARNVISGNSYGISHWSSGTATVQGNLIGTNKAGTAAVANLSGYVALADCNGGSVTSRIGGATPAARNVISGNAADAISLGNGAGVGCSELRATDSYVKGNYIGTDVTGTHPIPNSTYNGVTAISVNNGPNVSVGGTGAGEGNLIAFNTGAGVVVPRGSSSQNTRILGNRIFANGGMGIDLKGTGGPTPNDAFDADAGLQNFPVITGVSTSGGSTTIAGTLDSKVDTTYLVELFVNDAADATSHGEGQTLLGTTNVTTDGTGHGTFSVPVPVAVGATQFVTATATDPAGNTSEFSKLEADLLVTHVDTPDPVGLGQDVTHSLTVTNQASSAAPSTPVALTYTLATGATLVSPGGGQVAGSTITWALGTLTVGASATRTVVVRYASVGSKSSTATVTSAILDPVAANSAATATTTVTNAPQPTFTISGQVRDLNDTGVAGITMTLTGAQSRTLTTDLDGRYAFTGLAAGGTYTVTPTRATFAFVPPSQTFPTLARDEVASFFIAQVGTFTRYFAEGATSSFFDTQLALLNATGQPATATVRFQQATGAEVTTTVSLDGVQRVTIDPKTLGLTNSEFSTVIEATQPIIADRTMTWDGGRYGSHAETSIGRPLTQWFLAEGATINGFDLFYLVQNPNDTAVDVEVRYLRLVGAPLTKQYTVGPRSRFNIWVNLEDPGLDEAEVSAVVTSSAPVIVERAMYRPVAGQPFGAGHESAGVEAPALAWYFAEGATGGFFDLFFLVANPNAESAAIDARYLLPDGTVVSRQYDVPANSRFNIWVDHEGSELASTAVASTFRVTNARPVVIERAMWWAGGAAGWYEGHDAAGAIATGEKWGLAEGEVGGPFGLETYILIGNTSATAGTARLTLTFEDGTQIVRDYQLPASSRTSVAVGLEFPQAAGRRFGAIVESTGTTPAQLIVERAMYNDAGGVRWAAGTSALGTKLR